MKNIKEQTMNEQDKKAFEKWFVSNRDSSFAVFLRENYPDIGIKWDREPARIAWQAACEYKQKEYSNIMDAMTRTSQANAKLQSVNDELEKEQVRHIELLKDELKSENAKLRECVEFYADTNNWNTKNGECDTYVEGVITGDDLYSPWGDQGIDVGGKRARQVLKELDNNQLDDTK